MAARACGQLARRNVVEGRLRDAAELAGLYARNGGGVHAVDGRESASSSSTAGGHGDWIEGENAWKGLPEVESFKLRDFSEEADFHIGE